MEDESSQVVVSIFNSILISNLPKIPTIIKLLLPTTYYIACISKKNLIFQLVEI